MKGGEPPQVSTSTLYPMQPSRCKTCSCGWPSGGDIINMWLFVPWWSRSRGVMNGGGGGGCHTGIEYGTIPGVNLEVCLPYCQPSAPAWFPTGLRKSATRGHVFRQMVRDSSGREPPNDPDERVFQSSYHFPILEGERTVGDGLLDCSHVPQRGRYGRESDGAGLHSP